MLKLVVRESVYSEAQVLCAIVFYTRIMWSEHKAKCYVPNSRNTY
jgi:hypothetical protein